MFDTTNDVPPQSLKALDRDPDVAAWSGANLIPFQVDGQFVPSIVASPHARVAPPVLSGHGLDANNEILLGSATLAELHKHVGDTVYLSEGTPKSAPFYIPPTPLVVVGTATFPAIGYSSIIASQPSMGTGAMFPVLSSHRPCNGRRRSSDPILNGPQYVFVRLAKGVSAKTGLANLQRHRHQPQPGHQRRPPGRGQRRRQRPRSPAPGPDRQLPHHRGHPAGPGRRARCRGGPRPRSHPHRLRPPPAPRPGPAQSARVHPTATFCRHRLASDRRRPHRRFGGHSTRHRHGESSGYCSQINAVPDPTVPVLSVFLVAIGALVFANLVAAIPSGLQHDPNGLSAESQVRPTAGTTTSTPVSEDRLPHLVHRYYFK